MPLQEESLQLGGGPGPVREVGSGSRPEAFEVFTGLGVQATATLSPPTEIAGAPPGRRMTRDSYVLDLDLTTWLNLAEPLPLCERPVLKQEETFPLAPTVPDASVPLGPTPVFRGIPDSFVNVVGDHPVIAAGTRCGHSGLGQLPRDSSREG